MKKKKIMFAAILLFAFCLFSTIDNSKVLASSDEEVTTKGVYIDSIHIGGMTVAEANQAVQDYVDDLKSKKINIKIDDYSETITLGELDYNNVKNNYIEEALEVGKVGNLIKRYKELKDIEETKLVFNLEFKVSDKKIAAFIKSKCSVYDIPAVDATVTRKNNQFEYTDHYVGRIVDTDKTAATIKAAILEKWNQQDIELAATVIDDEPLYTREMVEKCNTIIGTFSTTYTTSSEDRAGNLANGAGLINNTVLYPGEVFSAYALMTPFTTDNGYFQAGAYANGKIIDSIGGGACQVTTTLYNAVLLGELEVVERAAHSMTISYADLSRDAAIAGTWKDFKFRNNTDAPIVVVAYTAGRTITFDIWGDEIRDKNIRKIKYETVVIEEKAPGKDVVTKDKTKPTTYLLTTQSAHIGYVTELYKIVTENGVEISRTRVNKSTYNASPRYVTVGTKKVKPTPTPTPILIPIEENTVDEITIEDNKNEDSAIDR